VIFGVTPLVRSLLTSAHPVHAAGLTSISRDQDLQQITAPSIGFAARQV
jgi:hypothetical protein